MVLLAFILASAALGAVSYGLWRARPLIAQRWKIIRSKLEAAAKDAPRKAPRKAKRPEQPDRAKPLAVEHLKKENEKLKAENQRLREQLKRTNEAVSLKNAQIDELKLRLLILEKTRPDTSR